MFKFWGKVVEGKKRGKSLGFPTANIKLHKKIPQGIYLSKVKVSDNTYNSLTFIGEAKTFNETNYQAESSLLDFKGNLYDKRINVKLIKKIRGNKKFKSEKELVDQMKKDREVAKKYFELYLKTS